jgi:hypothetical protein
MRIPRANDPSTDRRIEHLGDSWGMTPDRFLWSHIDARAVPARAARRILAPSQKSNLGSLVLYQLDCLDGNARRSCSCKQTPAAQPFVDITLFKAISGPHTLAVGLAWWLFGMALAVGYVVFVYTRFRGKVDLGSVAH